MAGAALKKNPVRARQAGARTPAVKTAATGAAPARPRTNRRSQETVEKILTVTEQIILDSGAERISILDVCNAAEISRGTFYRYFASQDELLDAFSRHTRERFHATLQEKVSGVQDPDERFAALVEVLDRFIQTGKAQRLLMVAPDFAVGWLRRIFHDSVGRFQDVLGVTYDAWEERLNVKLDRETISEMLIRYVLSEVLVVADTDRKALVRRIARMALAVAAGGSPRARR